MIIEDQETSFELKEATFDAFHAVGKNEFSLSSRDGYTSYPVNVKHDYSIETRDSIDSAADASEPVDGNSHFLIDRTTYEIERQSVGFRQQFEYEIESGIVADTEQIDEFTRNHFENSPLSVQPEFLLNSTEDGDQPPEIDFSGPILEEDLVYQMKANEEKSYPYCVNWRSTTEVSDAIEGMLGPKGDQEPTRLRKILLDLMHVGGGRPMHAEQAGSVGAAFCRHPGPGYSIGLWYPEGPTNAENIWNIAETLNAQFVSAVETFPTNFEWGVSPEIWNPISVRTNTQPLVQITWGTPEDLALAL